MLSVTGQIYLHLVASAGLTCIVPFEEGDWQRGIVDVKFCLSGIDFSGSVLLLPLLSVRQTDSAELMPLFLQCMNGPDPWARDSGGIN